MILSLSCGHIGDIRGTESVLCWLISLLGSGKCATPTNYTTGAGVGERGSFCFEKKKNHNCNLRVSLSLCRPIGITPLLLVIPTINLLIVIQTLAYQSF